MIVWDHGCVKSPLEACDGCQLLTVNLSPVVFFFVRQTSEAASLNLKPETATADVRRPAGLAGTL